MSAAATWTDDRIETLKALWTDGESTASQIAAKIGGISRNAVIGKAHRLGLAGDRPSSTKGMKINYPAERASARRVIDPLAAARRAEKQRQLSAAREREAARIEAERIGPDTPLPESRMIQIAELSHTVCHWPLGDPREPGFAFCGADIGSGKTYCPGHAALAYRPAEKKEARV
jgi:GcrA cell cycle regulator